MQRFVIYLESDDIGHCEVRELPHEQGEWVKADEALARIESLEEAQEILVGQFRYTAKALECSAARIAELEVALLDLTECDFIHGYAEDTHSASCRKCAILKMF